MSFRPNKPPPAGINPQYSSFGYQSGGFTPPTQAEAPRRDVRHQPGVPGGNWGEESSADSLQLYNSKRPGMPVVAAPPPRVEPTQPRRAPEQPKPHLTVSAEPGAYEKLVIDDLTQPGGARPRPPDRELTEFSNKCKFLSAEVISRLLFERLADPARALVTSHAEGALPHGATGD